MCALQQSSTSMQRQGAELRQGVIFGGAFGRRRQFNGHERLPHVFIDFMTIFGQPPLSHVRPVVINHGAGVGPGKILDLRTLLEQTFGQPYRA